MRKRYPLRSHLKLAWKKTINTRYAKTLINSERGLQVYFCEALLRRFKNDGGNRRLFIEPFLRFSDAKSGRRPDLVICSGKLIVGIVELKYCPRIELAAKRNRLSIAKDIETLSYAVEDAGQLRISNDRYLGISQGDKFYTLAKNAVLCWAGVYCGDRIDVISTISEKRLQKHFQEHFLQLDAITVKDSKPEIHV